MKYAFLFSVLLFPLTFAHASLVITEIMYDLEGSDTDREWIEIKNNSSANIDPALYKLYEANTNHGLKVYQGALEIPAGGYAVITDSPAKFLADWPNFSGIVIDSSFSLSNDGETLEIKLEEVTEHTVSYMKTDGAAGDGNSLHFDSGTRALAPTPGTGVENAGGTPPSTPSSPSPSSAGGGSTSNPVSNSSSQSSPSSKSTIFAEIQTERSTLVGGIVTFKGTAYGLERQPIANARYLWNMGDGTTKEGMQIEHIYTHPGSYTVVLDVSSGEYGASLKVSIDVSEAKISVSDFVEGPSGFLSLKNDSNFEVSLSGWHLRGSKVFTLPNKTYVGAHKTLMLSNDVTGLGTERMIELLYPNGALALTYTKKNLVAPAPMPAPPPVASAKPAVRKTEPKSDTTLASGEKKKEATATPIARTVENNGQTAAVLLASEESSRTPASSMIWIASLVGVICLGVPLALHFSRRKEEEGPASDITIID